MKTSPPPFIRSQTVMARNQPAARRRSHAVPALLLACCLLNAGCGMKGPLSLPSPAEQAQTDRTDKK